MLKLSNLFRIIEYLLENNYDFNLSLSHYFLVKNKYLLLKKHPSLYKGNKEIYLLENFILI